MRFCIRIGCVVGLLLMVNSGVTLLVASNSKKEYIKSGNEYIRSLYAGHDLLGNVNKQDIKAYQNAAIDIIIAICWALYAKAVEKGQAFTGGSIVMVDKDYKLYDFFLSYVKKLNPKGYKNVKLWTSNPYALRRKSTHFEEFKELDGYENYGIDMRRMIAGKKVKNVEKLLPCNKKHLLFNKVGVEGKCLTHTKFEDWGLCGKVTALKHLCGIGKKEGSFTRCETVPVAVNKKFKTIRDSINKHLAKKALKSDQTTKLQMLFESVKIDDDTYPIRVMYKIANIVKTLEKTDKFGNPTKFAWLVDKADDFVHYLETTYDHLDIRRGNEVILSAADFTSFKKM